MGDLSVPGNGGYEYEFLGVVRRWRYTETKMLELLDKGLIVHKTITPNSNRNVPGIKRYLDESKGALIGDIWGDINPLGRKAKESSGYPTQKPQELYGRIIKASSNKGDLVLDPFCGYGTTLVAAEHLSRQWVGIDIWEGSHEFVVKRLNDNRQLLLDIPDVIDFPLTVPPERTDYDT